MGEIVSDDFSGGTLNPVWTVLGPSGISSELATNATDAFLELITPDGNYDVWNTNNGARAMQATSDEDFQLETRFLSTPTQKYQMQGFLVQQDANDWVRFDTYSNGSSLRAFACITVNGVSTKVFDVAITGGSAPYLQVTRVGDAWTFKYSTDGTHWVTAGSFTHDLTVSSAGVFAGNTGAATGFTALVDYVQNTATPILNEDVPSGNVAPVAHDDAFSTDLSTPLIINVATDLLGNDHDANGDTLSLTGHTNPSNGTLVDNGNGTLTYTPNNGYDGTDSFTYTVSDGALADTATVTLVVGNPIDVWYGLDQTFGSPGEAQEWVNILGNVGGDVTSLSYQINGGDAHELSIGPDTRRLQHNGDFNVDIAYSALDGSANNDIVTITATLASGVSFSRDVTVHYQDGSVWPANYSIDWDTVSNIQDVVQVVDGTWEIDAGGVRPVDLGYDRLLVLGNSSWDNYELKMTVTTHDLLNMDPNGRDGGGFAIGMLWQGHTDDPIAGWQPKSGWEPGSSFFYTDDNGDGIGKWTLYPSEDFPHGLAAKTFGLQEDHTYNITVRVEQVGLYDRQYSLKVWEVGTPEPSNWTLQGVETFDISHAPATGSVYLDANYFDVAFNDLTVTEIPGRDIVQGTNGNDTLVAVDTHSAHPGAGEIDVLAGYGGSDRFVFGDANGAYYNDGNGSTSGTADYGFVWDFASGTDKIVLAGSPNDYVLTENAQGLPSGTAIWLAGHGGDQNELIAVLNGAHGLNLNSNDFIYDFVV